MIGRLRQLYFTLKPLKFRQFRYQLIYRISKPKALHQYDNQFDISKVLKLAFAEEPPVYRHLSGSRHFSFLNLEVKYDSEIDWNDQRHGKLWNYNLQYVNYLFQDDIGTDVKAQIIHSLYGSLFQQKLALEPYPVSLRVINVIRWYSRSGLNDPYILKAIHAELDFLSQRPEYHILGNHLLENAFALIMGGAFFAKLDWISQGQQLLENELEEQVLSDGAHFELSPMYHQIIFFRLLELIDWYAGWPGQSDRFLVFLRQKAAVMKTWLQNISFVNGDIPHFNDSADGVAYTTDWLCSYADKLGIASLSLPLGASGYRSVRKGDYECKIDFAQLGPSYQPGHAHADALSFLLYYQKQPVFVERGTSTYQIGKVRDQERSTASHNTVVVNHTNQSDVWGGFRVGRRAKVRITTDRADEMAAEHRGYRKYGLNHRRRIQFSENTIRISDDLRGNTHALKEFHLHLYPGLNPTVRDNEVRIGKILQLRLNGQEQIRTEDYQMADRFNRYRNAKKIVITFDETLDTTITFVPF